MNGERVTSVRNHFQKFIDEHQCYEGQISVCTKTFRRELMIPVLDLIKKMEKEINEINS